MHTLNRALAVLAFLLVGGASTNFTRFNTVVQNSGPPTADVVCNLATGVFTGLGGGTCATTTTTCAGGVDVAPAFNSFNTWALTFQAAHPGILFQLNTPADVCQFITGDANHNSFTQGIKRFQLVGYGTTLADNGGTGGGFALGRGGVQFNDTSSARFATISAGVSSITLLNTALCSLFNADDWTLLGGIDPQGHGDPPNPQIYEYIEIASVASCAGSGAITLKRATRYGYKSTWPLYNPGDFFHSDQGGPATIWALDQAWDISQAFYGLTLDQQGAQTNVNGRVMAFVDLTAPGGSCPIPSQNINWSITNGSISNCTLEVDKIVENVTMTNIIVRRFIIQSGNNPQNLTCNNCTFTLSMTGSAGTTTLNGGNVNDLTLGATSYGVSGAFSANNTVISALNLGGTNQPEINIRGIWSSGTLTVPANFHVLGSANNGSGLLRLTVDSTAGWSTGLLTDVTASVAAESCQSRSVLTVIDGTHFDVQGSDATLNNVAVSIASPAVITKASHGFSINNPIAFGTDGALPTGLIANTVYWIIPAGFTANSFQVSATQNGSAINTTGSQSGQQFVQCHANAGSLPLTWAVPGAYVYLSVNLPTLGPILQVDDLSVGANNETVVSFKLNGSPYAGGFPTIPLPGGVASITAHPAPSWTCLGCTGTQQILDITGPAMAGRPFGSYASRTLTAANSGIINMPVFGSLSELDVTVGVACGGASTISLDGPVITTLGSSSTSSWNPTVNGLIASATPRVVTPTGSSGAQSGDSLTSPGVDTWLVFNQQFPKYSSTGNCPSASTTVTIQTDQGVTYP